MRLRCFTAARHTLSREKRHKQVVAAEMNATVRGLLSIRSRDDRIVDIIALTKDVIDTDTVPLPLPVQKTNMKGF